MNASVETDKPMMKLFPVFLSLSLLFACFNETSRSRSSASINTEEKEHILTDTINASLSKKHRTPLELHLDSLGLKDISEADPTIYIDLKYATTDNFTGGILYTDLSIAYLHPLALEKLVKAQKILKEKNSALSLYVFDAARPLSVQKKMYEVVRGTKYQAYVANPSRTGLHNYGMAVDLSIIDTITGELLDMGTDFDFFGKLAGINNEDLFVSQKLLSQQQVDNRKLLRSVMTKAGFLTIRGEWWHFNAYSLADSRRLAKLIR